MIYERKACDRDVARFELTGWLRKLPEVDAVPWTGDATREHDLLSHEIADTWHARATADDENLLNLFGVWYALVVVAHDLFDLSDDFFKTWGDRVSDLFLLWRAVEAVEYLELVGLFERYIERFGEIDRERVPSDCSRTGNSHGSVEYSDLSYGRSDMNDDGWKIAMFS